MGHNLTPDMFFLGRQLLSLYNLALLILLWAKLRQSRSDKKKLELSFFQRVEGIMMTMAHVFKDEKFQTDDSI